MQTNSYHRLLYRSLMKYKTEFLLGSIIGLSACTTTPPGKLSANDFVSRSLTIQEPVTKSVSIFYEGFRYCGPSDGGVFIVLFYGVPECSPPSSEGSVTCDLYVPTSTGGRSGVVMGRATFSPIPEGTNAVLSVRSYAANKDRILDSWERFATGKAKLVCSKD